MEVARHVLLQSAQEQMNGDGSTGPREDSVATGGPTLSVVELAQWAES